MIEWRSAQSGYSIGLRGCGKCALKFCLGHLEEGLRGGSSHENRTASTKAEAVSLAQSGLDGAWTRFIRSHKQSPGVLTI
jgi:hypothetical protein